MTKNEEINLPACLDSVSWSDDVHVLDSYSEDRTVEIARDRGAIVTLRPFDNFADQQNYGLEQLPFRYDWVFCIDADERCTASLKQAMADAVRSPKGHVAFNVRRRDFFMGRWLRHVQATAYYPRLSRRFSLRYQRLVHSVPLIDGSVGTLSGYLDHYPFSKGIGDWVSKHNLYSTLEALQHVAERKDGVRFSWRTALLGRDRVERRRHLKGLFYGMPARPLLKFLWLYLWKAGFLDGRPGFVYALLIAFYEEMIVLKTEELERGVHLRT